MQNKEKQIEEIFKIVGSCVEVPDRECDKYGTCAHCKAVRIYNAGYRKQSKGEWKFNEERDSFVCSLCGGEALLDAHFIGLDYGIEVLSDYCPNCGAKMKGGAE